MTVFHEKLRLKCSQCSFTFNHCDKWTNSGITHWAGSKLAAYISWAVISSIIIITTTATTNKSNMNTTTTATTTKNNNNITTIIS